MGCDGIALVLNDDTVWDKPVADAMAKGIPVISIDCDDTEGIKGNERLCFIGQDERNAWRMIAERLFQKGKQKGVNFRKAHVAKRHRLGENRTGRVRKICFIIQSYEFFCEIVLKF